MPKVSARRLCGWTLGRASAILPKLRGRLGAAAPELAELEASFRNFGAALELDQLEASFRSLFSAIATFATCASVERIGPVAWSAV